MTISPSGREAVDYSTWGCWDIRDLTVGNLLARGASEYPDRDFIIDAVNGQRFSYAAVHAAAGRIAAGLASIGIGKGSHVAVMMDNSPDCILVYFSLARLGAIAVPLNNGARGELLGRLLAGARVTTAICDTDYLERLEEQRSAVDRLDIIVAGEDGARLSSGHVNLAMLKRCDGPVPEVAVRFSDPAFIMFTSGTTGASKGNVFTHAAAIQWERSLADLWDVDERDIYYVCSPLAHVAALFGIVFLMAALGGTVSVSRRFSASGFLTEVRATGATVAMLLGAMGVFLAKRPERAEDATNPLRLINLGPVPEDAEGFARRFGVRLATGYGLSDHSAACRSLPDTEPVKLRSCGKVAEPYELRIVDDEDFPLAPGEVGEILLRTNAPWRTASGYFERDGATAAARINDWFHTGDRGYLDEDGYLWFVDRKKDSIRRRGENISASEAEDIIRRHPGVADVAVYGVPSEYLEDEVCASVVLHEGASIRETDLVEFCVERMPAFMVPRLVHFTDCLPRTLTERVEKYKLQAWVTENRDKIWDREARLVEGAREA